jgi:hypothetical protein
MLSRCLPNLAGSRLKLFQACIGACRFDMQLALHLLPYVVQDVVSHGSDEARSGVQMEVRSLRRPQTGERIRSNPVTLFPCTGAGSY